MGAQPPSPPPPQHTQDVEHIFSVLVELDRAGQVLGQTPELGAGHGGVGGPLTGHVISPTSTSRLSRRQFPLQTPNTGRQVGDAQGVDENSTLTVSSVTPTLTPGERPPRYSRHMGASCSVKPRATYRPPELWLPHKCLMQWSRGGQQSKAQHWPGYPHTCPAPFSEDHTPLAPVPV